MTARTGAADPLAPPALARFADLEVEVGAAIEVGRVAGGLRRLIPIVGGPTASTSTTTPSAPRRRR
jgi:hypothetical protein